jgi:myo-inositol-hexaphosphate 3-phosphohydrolase
VSIDAADVAFDVNGDGRNVDSIAFWEAQGAEQSLMFVTSKDNASIEVYQYPFQAQLQTLSCGSETNGIWVDQERDVLYVTKRDSSEVCAFDLPDLDDNPSLRFTTAATGGDSEPNLTMLTLPGGQKRIYVSYDDTVYYHDAETAEPLGQFAPREGLETMYGDDYYQALYIPDESDRSGVYIYDAGGNPAGPAFGDRSIFDSDAEGIWVYQCRSAGGADSGEGLIVVADQKDEVTDFEVFDRRTKEYLGKINISGVNNTDGIAITQQASPAYPLGLLAVIDDDTSTVGIGWDILLAETGLSCGD